MGEPEMYALASSMDIDAMDVEQFFNILSADGTQPVDISSFVVGCMKMRGTAKSMDLLGLVYSQQQYQKHTTRLFRLLFQHMGIKMREIGDRTGLGLTAKARPEDNRGSNL